MNVDGETIHLGSGEGLIQSAARLRHERPAFNHFPMTWCFSHDDPVCHGRLRSRHERAIAKRAVSTTSERSLGNTRRILAPGEAVSSEGASSRFAVIVETYQRTRERVLHPVVAAASTGISDRVVGPIQRSMRRTLVRFRPQRQKGAATSTSSDRMALPVGQGPWPTVGGASLTCGSSLARVGNREVRGFENTPPPPPPPTTDRRREST